MEIITTDWLELIWDKDGNKWWESTVLWWKNEVYKLYDRSYITLSDLNTYRNIQNQFCNKKIDIILENSFIYQSKKINKLKITVLELPDNYRDWYDIINWKYVIIHEIKRIKWKTLKVALNNQSLVDSIKQKIEEKINNQYINWQIWWNNIKIISSNNWVLELTITDIAKSIKAFVNWIYIEN